MPLTNSLDLTLKTLPIGVTLVAVSKTRSVNEILELYNAGQRNFGENKVQELLQKQEVLPKDIQWHLIGHLQKNKVKYIVPFIYMIHSVDSLDLLKVIQKEAEKNNRTISVLLEIKIAVEDTKYGLSFENASFILSEVKSGKFPNIKIKGFMGMASFSDNKEQIKNEFSSLSSFYLQNKEEHNLDTLSMGMSNDYPIAIECGSNMVRIGTKLFGARNYTNI